MKLFSIQVALFYKELLPRPDLLFNVVNEKLGKIFDTPPQIMMNLPVELPADIPAVQATSTNRVYALNVARSRIDLIITPDFMKMVDIPSDVFKQYRQLIEKYCKCVMGEGEIIRMGLIQSLFEEASDNTKRIYEKCFKEKYELGCVEANYRINAQTQSKGVVYNNIKIVEAGDLHVNEQVCKGIIITLDTNNAVNNPPDFSSDTVNTILTVSANKIKPNAMKEMI